MLNVYAFSLLHYAKIIIIIEKQSIMPDKIAAYGEIIVYLCM